MDVFTQCIRGRNLGQSPGQELNPDGLTDGTDPADPRDSPFGPGNPIRSQRLCPDAGESPMVKEQYDQIAEQYEDAEKTIEGIHCETNFLEAVRCSCMSPICSRFSLREWDL
jgi:hypothetical protein